MGQGMDCTLGEQVMLLSLEDDTGVGQEAMRTGLAVTGAALVELALLGRVAVRGDGKVVVVDPAPVGEPALDPVLGALAGRDKPRKARDWVELLQKDAVNAARERLLERGLVREEKKRVWGIFPTRRYPEADGSVERELRDTLASVVHEGAEPDERTAALLGLLHGAGLQKLAFPDAQGKALDRRLTELAQGQWSVPVVRDAVKAVQAATTATIAAVTAVTLT
ncbi:GPP34 family phosphoprotein [Streptomyces flavidovirens]